MKLGIASDHAGFSLKAKILEYLSEQGWNCQDYGTDSAVERVDYPDFARKLSESVKSGEVERGIVICGTGVGVSIVANKVHGIRCAKCDDEYTARLSRLHNDSNVLALGSRVLGEELACSIVEVWLKTEFSSEERHKRRLNQIKKLETDSEN